MSAEAHVGVDLAWSTRARTGVAVVGSAGALVDSATVRTDDEIIGWLDHGGWDPVVVALDAPLIVTNATGRRACEALIGKAYGRYHAGPYPSNLGNPLFNPPRGGDLARRLGGSLDPGHLPTPGSPVCLEVYPHPAMVALFSLGRVLPYKSRRHRALPVRRSAFEALADHMEALQPLRLTTNTRWAQLRSVIGAATRPVDLKRAEDEIDAIFCAHLAWLWQHEPGTLQVYGSPTKGSIVAPPEPSHAPTR